MFVPKKARGKESSTNPTPAITTSLTTKQLTPEEPSQHTPSAGVRVSGHSGPDTPPMLKPHETMAFPRILNIGDTSVWDRSEGGQGKDLGAR